MKTCPACNKESSSDTECTNCGIYFAKWEKIHGGGAAAQENARSSISSSRAPEPEKKSNMRLAVIGAAALIGAGWLFLGGSPEKEIRRVHGEFNAAVSAGDLLRVKAMVPEKYAGEFGEAGADIKLKMMQAMQPADVKVTEVQVTGRKAVVRAQGIKNGVTVKGVTDLLKEGGGWKVVWHEWQFEMAASGRLAGSAPGTEEADTVPEISGEITPSVPEAAVRAPSAGSPAAGGSGSYGQMTVPELLADLKTDVIYKQRVFDELIARGERGQAVDTLNEMLRDKGDDTSPSRAVKILLKKAGAPVTYDWKIDTREPLPEDKFSLVSWEAEMRNGSIVTSGKVYVGREVAAGFTRAQTGQFTMPVFARYEFTVTGPGLAQPVVKVVDAEPRAGEQQWDGLTLASGLAPGEYKVGVYLNAQTVQANGVPLSLNYSAIPLAVEKN